jgi:hypothetical protein
MPTMTDTTAGRDVAIYLDTVTLLANGWPKQPSADLVALLELLAAVELKPHIPTVCRFEMRRQWQARLGRECQEARQAHEQLAVKYRKLRRYDAPDLLPLVLPTEDEQMQIYDRLVQEHFARGDYLDVPLPATSLAQLVQDSAEHRPPFPRAEDEGFRDGLIALSVAAHASARNLRAVFITSDQRLGAAATWDKVFPDVALVKLDDPGLGRIGEILKTTPISLARRAEIQRVEAAREELAREHRRMVSVLRGELNEKDRFEALRSFVAARMRANPQAVLSIPGDWDIPLDVDFGRIINVRTDDPSATLTAGLHAATAVIRLRLRFSTRLDQTVTRRVMGVRIPMRVPGQSVNYLTGKASVSVRVNVGEDGAVRDVKLEDVAFHDFTPLPDKPFVTFHG